MYGYTNGRAIATRTSIRAISAGRTSACYDAGGKEDKLDLIAVVDRHLGGCSLRRDLVLLFEVEF